MQEELSEAKGMWRLRNSVKLAKALAVSSRDLFVDLP